MTTPIVSGAFIDLVCADVDLLRDEFDAIMAAEFPCRRRPPDRRRGGTDRPDLPTGTPGTAPTPIDGSRDQPAGAPAAQPRERSPPGAPSSS